MRLSIACIALVAWSGLDAQKSDTSAAVRLSILSGYYEQDGNHAAVTGGVGSQELTDVFGQIIIDIAMDSASRIQLNSRVNYYSSASTDRIDRVISSASAHDTHSEVDFSFTRRVSPQLNWSVGAAGGIESDYLSTSMYGRVQKVANAGRTLIDFSLRYYADVWKIILPQEVRNDTMFYPGTDRRRTYAFHTSVAGPLSSKIKGGAAVGLIYQSGLLSTPFHRVYFADTSIVGAERLPGSRWRLPLTFRLNMFIHRSLLMRNTLTLYADSDGLKSLSFQQGYPIKLLRGIAVTPFLRLHLQQGHRWFRPLGLHSIQAPFFTSDWDLAPIRSFRLGLQLRWEPLYGFRLMGLPFRYFSARIFWYQRSDGLRSTAMSIGLLNH